MCVAGSPAASLTPPREPTYDRRQVPGVLPVPETAQPSPSPAGGTPSAARRYCVFCEIIAGREPADVLYRDDEIIVFRNVLRWVPVMLLVVPVRHMRQNELWRDVARAGAVAVQMGERYCPNGFR